jgi:adenine C2-methylase RlmN of 23S rRNA A2503 and tRNA A37
MCLFNHEASGFRQVQLTAKELISQVQLFKKYGVINIQNYIFNG